MDKVLSASKAGFPCSRYLWFAVNGNSGNVSPKSQRIFDVGSALEPVAVHWLRLDGWNVEYNPGSQNADISVSVPVNGGILTGHPDCIISKGDIQNALVDIKTMNDRAFRLWRQEGTLKSKMQYVIQLHIYALGLRRSGRDIQKLGIVGVNKNNSEMFIDFFDFDQSIANNIIERAQNIFSLTQPPEDICPAEAWACAYCEYSGFCPLAVQPKHSDPVGKDVATTDDETIIDAMRELKQARELGKEAKELEEHAKSVLNENVRDKGIQAIAGGGLLFELAERTSSRFDQAAFKNEHPELVAQFTKKSVAVLYNIKEI